MGRFVNEVALVTGGGSGIGEALATALAAKGSRVVVADIQAEDAESVARRIRGAGGSALAVQCDVCERGSIDRAVAAAEEAFGPVSLLFANAGVTAFEPLVEMSDVDIDWLLAVNLRGVMSCVQACVPGMLAGGKGHVVATASMAGLIPSWMPHHVPYVSAKIGLIGMMMNLRHDYAASGIGFTALCPGGVVTRITKSPARRPARFGGPGGVPVPVQTEVIEATGIAFLPADRVAEMTLEAVEANRALVVTDGSRRAFFRDTYVAAVEEAFDACAAFEARNG